VYSIFAEILFHFSNIVLAKVREKEFIQLIEIIYVSSFNLWIFHNMISIGIIVIVHVLCNILLIIFHVITRYVNLYSVYEIHIYDMIVEHIFYNLPGDIHI